MMRSDSPPEYDSALSKKLTPASRAAPRQSAARLSSSWGPKVTHEPKDRTLTLSPVRPSRRYSISMGNAPFRCQAARGEPTSPAAMASHRRGDERCAWVGTAAESPRPRASGPARSHQPAVPDGLDAHHLAGGGGVDDVAAAH